MLIFHRPQFLNGRFKVQDVKFDDEGKPLKDENGNPCFVYWHLTPDMRDKTIKFNDESYVKNKYPSFFFENDEEIKAFYKKKLENSNRMNTKKAELRQNELKKWLDDGLIDQADYDDFLKERKRLGNDT